MYLMVSFPFGFTWKCPKSEMLEDYYQANDAGDMRIIRLQDGSFEKLKQNSRDTWILIEDINERKTP